MCFDLNKDCRNMEYSMQLWCMASFLRALVALMVCDFLQDLEWSHSLLSWNYSAWDASKRLKTTASTLQMWGRLWEVAQRFSEVDESFNFQECAHQECMLTGDEPEVEACIPEDMPEEHNTMQVAPPFEQNSPEHMAQWMIGGSWKCSQGEGLRGMQTNHGLSEQNLPKRSSAKAKRLEHDE